MSLLGHLNMGTHALLGNRGTVLCLGPGGGAGSATAAGRAGGAGAKAELPPPRGDVAVAGNNLRQHLGLRAPSSSASRYPAPQTASCSSAGERGQNARGRRRRLVPPQGTRQPRLASGHSGKAPCSLPAAVTLAGHAASHGSAGRFLLCLRRGCRGCRGCRSLRGEAFPSHGGNGAGSGGGGTPGTEAARASQGWFSRDTPHPPPQGQAWFLPRSPEHRAQTHVCTRAWAPRVAAGTQHPQLGTA